MYSVLNRLSEYIVLPIKQITSYTFLLVFKIIETFSVSLITRFLSKTILKFGTIVMSLISN